MLRFAPAALFAVLVMLVYAEPLVTRRSFVGRDLLPYGLPLERAVHEAWSRGRVPVWSEDVSGGRPLLPNPNAGVFYPIRPLLSVVSFPTAMRLFPVFHWMFAGWGMLALLGALGGSREARWIAAATYAFSGVIVSEVFYLPLQAGAALQPWALWVLVRPGASFGGRAVGLGAVYGLMFLAGDAVSIGIALLAAAAWVAFEVSGSQRRESAAAVAVGLSLGALFAAPQLAATALLAPETRRAVSGFSVGEALNYSVSPWRLLELAVPYPFGDAWNLDGSGNWGREVFRWFFATLYCGAFALMAMLLPRRSRGGRFTAALFAATAILATAGTFVPRAWHALPSPVPLRYPEKLAVGLTLALAVQAGLGFDRIAGSPRRGARLALAVAGALALLAAASTLAPAAAKSFASALGAAPREAAVAPRRLPAALAEAGLGWSATFLALGLLGSAPPSRRLTAAVLLAFVPILATRRIVRTERDDLTFAPTAFARANALRDPAGVFRTVDASRYRPPSDLDRMIGDPDSSAYYRRSWYFHTSSLWDRGTVFNSDLDVGDLSRVESLRRVSSYAAAGPGGASLFTAVSLRFAIRYRDQAPLPGFVRFGGDALQDWDESPAAEPDVRLVSRWREAADSVSALSMLPELSVGEVVLETGRPGAGSARPGSIRWLERSPERMALETSSPDAGWLFVLRGFWDHRAVRVDGRPVEPVPAQLAFTSVPVPAGEHRILWEEKIPGIRASAFGPPFACAAAAILLRRRRSGAPGRA